MTIARMKTQSSGFVLLGFFEGRRKRIPRALSYSKSLRMLLKTLRVDLDLSLVLVRMPCSRNWMRKLQKSQRDWRSKISRRFGRLVTSKIADIGMTSVEGMGSLSVSAKIWAAPVCKIVPTVTIALVKFSGP